MNVQSQLVKQEDVSKTVLEDIAKIKSIRWNYSLESQLKWIEENLKEEDYHLLIYNNQNLIAYTNFVDIEVTINDSSIKFKGIGNVCTSESGLGYGDLLMQTINKSIQQNNWYGILLCKDGLLPYYKKFCWNVVPQNIIESNQLNGINVMIFNFVGALMNIKYNNRLF